MDKQKILHKPKINITGWNGIFYNATETSLTEIIVEVLRKSILKPNLSFVVQTVFITADGSRNDISRKLK